MVDAASATRSRYPAMMIIYEVTVELSGADAAAFEDYMRREHIPQILATACFATIHFQRENATRYRTSYWAADERDLERYLDEHAGHFRGDFAARFPAGVTPSRANWHVVESWTRT